MTDWIGKRARLVRDGDGNPTGDNAPIGVIVDVSLNGFVLRLEHNGDADVVFRADAADVELVDGA